MILKYSKSIEHICEQIIEHITNISKNNKINIAISGGNTPRLLFSLMSENKFVNRIYWSNICIYWVDERCVLPTDNDSNYKMTNDTMLSKVPISCDNIFRIRGEDSPQEEVKRYNSLVTSQLPTKDGFPIFDIVLLGIGEDGHTSSIFPTQMELLNSQLAYDVAINPYSGQKRISMTGNTIINSKEIIFLVTGSSKKNVIHNIIENNIDSDNYPSKFILSKRVDALIYTDIIL